ncbi:hypothetical protein DSECCO2_549340 [anaerobic digester metagenome]
MLAACSPASVWINSGHAVLNAQRSQVASRRREVGILSFFSERRRFGRHMSGTEIG